MRVSVRFESPGDRIIQSHFATLTSTRERLLFVPWNRILQNVTGPKLVNKFHTFHGPLTLHYRIYKHPPPVPILRHINPAYAIHHNSLRSSLILFSHLRLGLPSDLFSSAFSTRNRSAPILKLIRATCRACQILLAFITRRILGREYSS